MKPRGRVLGPAHTHTLQRLRGGQPQPTTPKSSRTNPARMSSPILTGIATPSWRST
jgi:hypothetical protein